MKGNYDVKHLRCTIVHLFAKVTFFLEFVMRICDCFEFLKKSKR